LDEALGLRILAAAGGRLRFQHASGNGLPPILLVTADETSAGRIERLEHEYALVRTCQLQGAAGSAPRLLSATDRLVVDGNAIRTRGGHRDVF
jgi:hypothetical protein